MFEYKDLWITAHSERHKRLLGYVQVYDMQGMSWRHYSSREIADKLKTALQSGSFYVEVHASGSWQGKTLTESCQLIHINISTCVGKLLFYLTSRLGTLDCLENTRSLHDGN